MMHFIHDYDLKIKGFVEIEGVRQEIDFDLNKPRPTISFVKTAHFSLWGEIKKLFAEHLHLSQLVKYDLTVTGTVNCGDMLTDGELSIKFCNIKPEEKHEISGV